MHNTACKGPPVMNDEERLAAVEGCRFVDEVVPGVPYVMNEAYLRQVMEKYRIDYVVHGDDPCIVDGKVSCFARACVCMCVCVCEYVCVSMCVCVVYVCLCVHARGMPWTTIYSIYTYSSETDYMHTRTIRTCTSCRRRWAST